MDDTTRSRRQAQLRRFGARMLRLRAVRPALYFGLVLLVSLAVAALALVLSRLLVGR